jgi:pimeloyl-ACP methyl ester carboxylesterase
MASPLMQRPVMDPLFLEHIQQAPPRYGRVRQLARAAGRAARWTGALMLRRPLARPKDRLSFPSDGWVGPFARGLAYRLLCAPILLALASAALVYRGTHPQAAEAGGDPTSFGVYYDPIDFKAEDGVQLTGWLVPVIDARRVMLHRDRLLHQTYPAVVLVHDHGQSPAQMLPLIAPLHEDGIVVLAVGLRGTGRRATVGQTFGLDESADVLAAVNVLRRRQFVDPNRIAVVGLGTGANAAVLAAQRDPGIAALVLANPVVSANDVVAERLGPDQFGLRWLQPAAKWAFEIAYHHDVDELSLNQHQSLLAARKHLRVEKATTDGRLMAEPTEKIRTFCRETLQPWAKAAGK